METNKRRFLVRVERENNTPFMYYEYAVNITDEWQNADRAKELLNAEKVEVWSAENLEYLFCITNKL